MQVGFRFLGGNAKVTVFFRMAKLNLSYPYNLCQTLLN